MGYEEVEDGNIPYVFIDCQFSKIRKNLVIIGPDLKGSGYIAGKIIEFLWPCDDILVC